MVSRSILGRELYTLPSELSFCLGFLSSLLTGYRAPWQLATLHHRFLSNLRFWCLTFAPDPSGLGLVATADYEFLDSIWGSWGLHEVSMMSLSFDYALQLEDRVGPIIIWVYRNSSPPAAKTRGPQDMITDLAKSPYEMQDTEWRQRIGRTKTSWPHHQSLPGPICKISLGSANITFFKKKEKHYKTRCS